MRIKKIYQGAFPKAEIKSINALDVQCCYPFFNLKEEISLSKDFSDDLPFPRYELFDSINYLSTNWRIGLWHYPLLTSLGCPYQCVFCASRNREYKTRSADNCVAELRQAKEKYGIVSFEILDDVFNLDKRRVMEFCAKVKTLGLLWLCSNGLRADKFDEEQARALLSSGCHTAGFGIESMDDEVLGKIKKGEKREHIEKAVKIAKKYFSEVKGYFIVGLPGSNYKKDMASILWAREAGIKPIVSYYVPDTINFGDGDVASAQKIFYGSRATPLSDAYPPEDQKKVYRLSKKHVRGIYQKQRLPLRLIYLTLKGLAGYNLNSLRTHLSIGPKRLVGMLLRGEVQ